MYRILLHPNPSALRQLSSSQLVQEIQRFGDDAEYQRRFGDAAAWFLQDHVRDGHASPSSSGSAESELQGAIEGHRLIDEQNGATLSAHRAQWLPSEVEPIPASPRLRPPRASPSPSRTVTERSDDEEEKKSPVRASAPRLRRDVFPSASPVAGPLVASRTVTEVFSQEEEKKSPVRPPVGRNLFAAFQAQQARAALETPPRHQLRPRRFLSPLPSPIMRQIEADLAFEGDGRDTPSAEGEWVIPKDTPYKSESPDSDAE